MLIGIDDSSIHPIFVHMTIPMGVIEIFLKSKVIDQNQTR